MGSTRSCPSSASGIPPRPLPWLPRTASTCLRSMACAARRYQLIADVVAETAPCGAVRHGAECSRDPSGRAARSLWSGERSAESALRASSRGNFYFPQAGPGRAWPTRTLTLLEILILCLSTLRGAGRRVPGSLARLQRDARQAGRP